MAQHVAALKLFEVAVAAEHFSVSRIVHKIKAANGASVADAVSSRSGDFVLDDAIIHCTMAPGDALLQKCKDNLSNGTQPIILTVGKGVGVAQGLAETHGIEGRVEVMDALQFLAANLYEMSLFKAGDRRIKISQLVEKYNEIIAANESDASLRIAFD